MSSRRCAARQWRMRGSAHRRKICAPALALAMSAAVACAGASSDAHARRHTVEMNGFAFRPATLRVAAGDTIVWMNRDVVPHTATAQEGTWDSRAVAKDGEWIIVLNERGSVSYMCTLHPSMTGLIDVR